MHRIKPLYIYVFQFVKPQTLTEEDVLHKDWFCGTWVGRQYNMNPILDGSFKASLIFIAYIDVLLICIIT